MSAAIRSALTHLDNQAMGIATRKVGVAGGDGGKIINGFPVVHPGSKLEQQMRKEAEELDAINRETRRRFFGEEYQEPIKMAPREEIVPIERPRRAASIVTAPKLLPVPTEEQQRIRALVAGARETRGFMRRLRAAMKWDWAQFNGWLTGSIVSTPKTWAKVEEVVPQILANIETFVYQKVGNKKLSPNASDDEVMATRAWMATQRIPYGFWLHLRKLARVSSEAAYLVKPSTVGGNYLPKKVTVAQLQRIREVIASGAVHAACDTLTTTRAARMRERRAAMKKPLATEAQTIR